MTRKIVEFLRLRQELRILREKRMIHRNDQQLYVHRLYVLWSEMTDDERNTVEQKLDR